MAKLSSLLLFLMLLTAFSYSAKIGVVVQYDADRAVTKCVSFNGDETAADILQKGFLPVLNYDWPSFGPALCGINDVGCPADNCWCSASYWGFYYMQAGGWVPSSVGVGYHTDDPSSLPPGENGFRFIRDGGVIGFRWGGWGDQPNVIPFDEICKPAHSRSVKLSLDVANSSAGYPTGAAINITALQDGEPTLGLSGKVLYFNGFWWEPYAAFAIDENGRGSFAPDKPGIYEIEISKLGYAPEYKTIIIEEKKESAPTPAPEPVGTFAMQTPILPAQGETLKQKLDIIAFLTRGIVSFASEVV